MRPCAAFLSPAAFTLAAAFLLAPSARAFDSFPGWSQPHSTITSDASRRVGWGEVRASQLAHDVRAVDWDEARWAPRFGDLRRAVATARYRPEHHFDRPPDSTSRSAFDAGRRYYQRQLAAARSLALAGEHRKCVQALGRAMHALQDLHAHSNLVDLAPLTVRAVYEALDDTLAAAPDSLRLTSYAGWPYGPAGPPRDPAEPAHDIEHYSHHRFAKDDARVNAESSLPCASPLCGGPARATKFECAASLAIEASTRMLNRFLEPLDVPTRHALARR